MTQAECPQCKLIVQEDEEIEAKFGFRNIQGKSILQSWCKRCRSGKRSEETQETDRKERSKIKNHIQSYVNRLDNVETLKELFLKPDGLNYNYKNEDIPTDDWSKESQKIIGDYNVEIKQIAEKVGIEIIYVNINSNEEKVWKKIAKEIFKKRAGYCLIITHNLSEQKKWLFSSGTSSNEFIKNISLEITNQSIPINFIEWLTKIKASNNETLTTLISKINSSFDDYTIDIQDKLGENIFHALKVLINETIFNKENNLELNDETLKTINEPLFTLLYRLVFILYAESREIFDTNNVKYYNDFSLKKIIHTIIIDHEKDPRLIKLKKYELLERLQNLFSLIENGSKYLRIDASELDMPAYNGSLFNSEKHPQLVRWKFSNESVIKVIHQLTRIKDKEKNLSFVNYAAIEIRHIGSIYEKLLEFHPVKQGNDIEIFTHGEKREAEGTYYTPKYIVDNIIENALGPLIDNIIKNTKNPRDQTEKILQIKILDPAMGSGHFLVAAAEYLGKRLVEIDKDNSEQNLIERKRDAVRRCLYGVDVNALAVELAKVSLWLDTLSSEHALSFLATHLKHGNSILSSKRENIFEPQTSLMEDQSRAFFRDFVKQYSAFETMDDHRASTVKAKIEEERDVRKSGSIYDQLKYLLDNDLAKNFGHQIKEWRDLRGKIGTKEFNKTVQGVDWALNRKFALDNYFFHWELEFPQVFFNDKGEKLENPGFDVVLGNPPYGVKFEGDYYEKFGLGSKESYGFFMIRAVELAKNHGVISMVVNDTWRNLKTKKFLREKLLSVVRINRLIKLSRYAFKVMGSKNIDAFTIIYEMIKEPSNKQTKYFFYDLGFMLHPIKNYEFFNSLIKHANYKTENDEWPFDQTITKRYTINQNVINLSENLSIFEGSSELFKLFNKNAPEKTVEI